MCVYVCVCVCMCVYVCVCVCNTLEICWFSSHTWMITTSPSVRIPSIPADPVYICVVSVVSLYNYVYYCDTCYDQYRMPSRPPTSVVV
jgi:hypothetical protein